MQVSVFAVALTAHGGTSLFTDGLQVQFRTDHDGRVVADTLFPVHASPINSWTTEDGVASPLTLVIHHQLPAFTQTQFH